MGLRQRGGVYRGLAHEGGEEAEEECEGEGNKEDKQDEGNEADQEKEEEGNE